MSGKVNTHVLDTGLTNLKAEATDIYICSAEPSTFAEATTTFALGHKTFGAGNCMGSPTAASPNGQKCVTIAVTDGDVTGTDTATWWAIVDTNNNRLLVDNALSASQSVNSGNIFSLPAFEIRIPSVAA